MNVNPVYEFEDMDNHRRYIGMHKAMEKPYWTSATDKDFQKVLMNPDSNLKLTIHKWGSVQEMKQLEYEMLTKVDAAKHKGYYNKHNGHPGVKEIDYDKIAQLRNELDFIRDNRHDKVNEFQIIGFEYLSDKSPADKLCLSSYAFLSSYVLMSSTAPTIFSLKSLESK